MRAVLDPNVVISGALSPSGAPAQILRAIAEGEFELIASQQLLDELARALGYPELRRRIDDADAAALTRWIETNATMATDLTTQPPVSSSDPADNHLIALAAENVAALVSGDKDLLELREHIPVYAPRDFLDLLARS